MKKMKKFRILYLIGFIAIFATSCDTHDDYEVDRATIASFTKATNNINSVPTGTFKSIDVEVFVTDVTDADRVFNIVVVPAILIEGQVEASPDNYTFDSTVTIPAGSRIGEITVSGTNSSIIEPQEYFSLGVEGPGVVSGRKTTIRLRT